jgi:hypothetical protein
MQTGGQSPIRYWAAIATPHLSRPHLFLKADIHHAAGKINEDILGAQKEITDFFERQLTVQNLTQI